MRHFRYADVHQTLRNPSAYPQQPVGSLYTLHLDDARTVTRFSWTKDNPFGELDAGQALTVSRLRLDLDEAAP